MLKRLLLVLFVSFLCACAGLPENSTLPSSAIGNSGYSYLSQESANHHHDLNIKKSDALMTLLPHGVDSFAARIALIDAAEESIDLQYYLFHTDLSGSLIIAALWRAAERGVRIRVLVDDINLQGSDDYIAKINAHPHFEIRTFNPFLRSKSRLSQYVTGLGTVTRRMHNKSFTADGSIAILGGRNLGDEYFSAAPDVNFGDLDILFSGDAVQEVQQAFDLYWNNPLSFNINLLTDYQPKTHDLRDMTQGLATFVKQNDNSLYSQAVRENDLVELIKSKKVASYQGKAIVLYDDPLKIVSPYHDKQYNLAPKLRPYIESVQSELILISPYFVPGKEGMLLFQALIDRGISIKILTNSMQSNDVAIVHSGYVKYRKKLLQMGVELHEIDSKELNDLVLKSNKMRSSEASKLGLHAKYYILDRSTTFIGSFNLDPRSRNENTEIGIVVQSKPLGRYLAEQFDKDITEVAFKLALSDNNIIWTKTNNGETKQYNNEPYSSWWGRFKNTLMSQLPVESQL